MPKSDSDFIDRLIERLDLLDPNSLQGYILKLVREKGVLETVFETIREGVIIIDRTLRLEFANNAAKTMLGIPESFKSSQATKVNQYLHDLDWERLMSSDPAEWEKISRQEIEINYPKYRRLLFYLLPYNNETDDDELSMAIIILHDITELKERAESKIESEKLNAITTLAGSVAHEIGNPLNSINIHLQLLDRFFKKKDKSEEEEDAHELVEIALEEISRLDQIISTFLKALRPSQMDLKALSLQAVIESSLKSMKQELKNKSIMVECEWGKHLPDILADKNQLKQVFYNIFKNALQAMPDGGLLGIKLDEKNDFLFLEITDNGKGIQMDEIGNLSQPFYTTKEEGTGLGLVIVERILRDHGAEFGIESIPGKGTVFSIRFPLKDKRSRLLEAPVVDVEMIKKKDE